MDIHSSVRNSCFCIKCASQSCLECRHQEASYCTCDKTEPLSSPPKNETGDNENEDNNKDDSKLTKEEKTERCKKCHKIINESGKKPVILFEKKKKHCEKSCILTNAHKSVHHQVPITKICPAFCPICHKIFNDEQNDEQPSNNNIITLNECPKCQEAPPGTVSDSEAAPDAPPDNADTDTKSIDKTPKCSKCKELKINSQSIEERVYPKLCEILKEINCCCPKEKSETEPIKKCHTGCGVCSCTQTKEKKQGALNGVNLSSEQIDNIRIWIKECVHKELKDVRKPVNNEGKEINSNKNKCKIHYCVNEKRKIKNHEHFYKKKRSPVTIYTSLTHQLYYPRVKTIDSAYSSLSSRTTSVSLIPQNYWALRANAHVMSDSIDQCDCKPCECHKCKKHFLEGHIPYRQCNCSCEICDCFNCATLNIYYEMEKKFHEKSEQMCNYLPCHFKHCSKYRNIRDGCDNSNCDIAISSFNSANLLPLAKVTNSERFTNCILSNKESKNLTTAINKSLFSKKTQNDYHVWYNKGICIKAGIKYNNSLNQQDSKLCCQKKSHESKDTHATHNSSQISHNAEGNDSTISSSMSSNVRIIEPFNKESKNRKSIRRNSCNSSGYDYSDYLIRFPTSTVETCIKDVMSLPYNKPDKDYSNLSPTSKPVKDYSESPLNTVHYQNKLPIPGQQSFDKLQLDSTSKNCKSGNSDKSCDCNPCDCDKCYYKIPKLKRCRCDCASCRCDGTCLSEDISVVIRKNEFTQTAIFAPDCEEVDRKELSSLKFKKSDVTFSDKNKIVKWTDFPMSQCTHNTKGSTIPTVNYDKVQRTIREAQNFSLELLGILQKYEKANRDLDNMRQRFKSLHESILCEDVDGKQFSEHSNNCQIAFIKSLPTYQNNTNNEKSRIKFEDGILENSKLSTNVIEIHSTTSETDMQKQILESDVKLEDGKIFQDNYIKNSLNKNASIPSFENSKYSYQDNTKQTESIFNADHSLSNQINVKNSAQSYLKKLKSEYKKYSLYLEEAINKRRQTVWKNQKYDTMIENQVKENITNKYSMQPSKLNGFSFQIPPVKEFMNKQNSGDLNTVFVCQCQKYHESYLYNKTFPKILNVEPLDSLNNIVVDDKKETSVVGNVKADHNLVQLSSTAHLQSQCRQAYESSTSTPRIASSRSELSPSIIRSATIDTNAIKTCNSNSLKVIFQKIRKVSEHSILLKWKNPDDTRNIKGYEIKVDGRSIQRILNPTRNMAVLTCLPHADKMLITVRTITKMADGISPCAIISYCNRG